MTMNRLAKRLERIARMLVADEDGTKFVVKGNIEYVEDSSDGDFVEGKVTRISGSFDSIEDLIKAVCKKFGLTYNKGHWEYEISENENEVVFFAEFLGTIAVTKVTIQKEGLSGNVEPIDSEDLIGFTKSSDGVDEL